MIHWGQLLYEFIGNPGLQPSKRPSGGASPQPDLRPTEPVRQSARAARQPGARERLSHSSSAPGVALKSQRKALRLRCTVGGCPGHLPRLCSPPASPSSAARPPHLPRLWSLPTPLPLLRDPLTCPGYEGTTRGGTGNPVHHLENPAGSTNMFPQPWSPWAGPRGLCTLFTTPSRHMSQSEHSGRAGPQGKELRPTFPVNKILQRMSMEV